MKHTTKPNCLNCGTQVSNHPKIYCNNKCQAEYQYKQWIERWKAGLEKGHNSIGNVSLHIRRYLIETRSEKCELCGWNQINQFTKKIPLEVDHIDGNHTNNDESNLRIICPNCHSLTGTYRGLNRGSGRAWRKKSR